MKKIIMIFIDAFSSKYLSSEIAPYLYQLSCQDYTKKIEPLPAFMGIGTTIFTGTWPSTNGAWTNFIRNQSNITQSASIESKIFRIFDLIPNDRIIWDFRYILYRLLKRPIPIPNLVPSCLVDFFKSKVESPIFNENALGNVPTIFDVLRSNGKTIKIINRFNDSDEKITNRTINYLKDGIYSDLTYLKYSSLDTIGHKFGPSSERTLERIKIIDNTIKKIINTAMSYNEDFSFVIFSDHGMSPVYDYFDVLKKLNENTSSKLIKDYLVFIDSTMARFWFKNQRAHDEIFKFLSKIDKGFILSDLDLTENNLPLNEAEHGELIFSLKDGVVMHPDFFHKHTIMRGMHGHSKSTYDEPILLTYPQKMIEDGINGRFVDITPTTLKLFNIKTPDISEGKSLI